MKIIKAVLTIVYDYGGCFFIIPGLTFFQRNLIVDTRQRLTVSENVSYTTYLKPQDPLDACCKWKPLVQDGHHCRLFKYPDGLVHPQHIFEKYATH